MIRVISISCFIGIAGLFFINCGKKQESPVVKEELLPEGDLEELLEEPELESVEEDELEEESLEPALTEKPKSVSSSEGSAADEPSSAGISVSSTVSFSSTGEYVVQVSIFKNSGSAENLKNKLSSMGYPAYIAEVVDPIPELIGTYYRVRVGPFSGLQEAKSFGEETLQPMQYDFWVDLKSNDSRSKRPSQLESVYKRPPENDWESTKDSEDERSSDDESNEWDSVE